MIELLSALLYVLMFMMILAPLIGIGALSRGFFKVAAVLMGTSWLFWWAILECYFS
jgi:hypothetical protein